MRAATATAQITFCLPAHIGVIYTSCIGFSASKLVICKLRVQAGNMIFAKFEMYIRVLRDCNGERDIECAQCSECLVSIWRVFCHCLYIVLEVVSFSIVCTHTHTHVSNKMNISRASNIVIQLLQRHNIPCATKLWSSSIQKGKNIDCAQQPCRRNSKMHFVQMGRPHQQTSLLLLWATLMPLPISTVPTYS